MNVPARLALFGLLLALVFGGGVALGDAVGPLGNDQSPPPHADHGQ